MTRDACWIRLPVRNLTALTGLRTFLGGFRQSPHKLDIQQDLNHVWLLARDASV